MNKDEMETLAKEVRALCPACKEDIPLKGVPSGGLIHLDVLATPEAGAVYECRAAEKLGQVILGRDKRHNPLYVSGWEELISDLWSSDPDIWAGEDASEEKEPEG